MRFPRIHIPRPVLIFLVGAFAGSFVTLKATSPKTLSFDSAQPDAGQVQGVSTDQETAGEFVPTQDQSLPLGAVAPSLDQQKKIQAIDGDTIRLATGEKVRYIGINTAEVGDAGKDGCLADAARAANARLVEGKEVKMEKDVSETDQYRRKLRYVWVGDVFVNEALVAQGLARAVAYPPDVKYKKLFVQAEERARSDRLGMWGELCAGVATLPSTSRSEPKPNAAPSPAQGAPTLLPRSNTCVVKGNISSGGEKIYHMPGCANYTRTQIDESKGERWFCDENEAQDAGWRKTKDCS